MKLLTTETISLKDFNRIIRAFLITAPLLGLIILGYLVYSGAVIQPWPIYITGSVLGIVVGLFFGLSQNNQ